MHSRCINCKEWMCYFKEDQTPYYLPGRKSIFFLRYCKYKKVKVLIQQFRLTETCYFLISFFGIFDSAENVYLRNCYQKYTQNQLLELHGLYVGRKHPISIFLAC